ncbi:MAG: hypothetical protein KC517_09165 [Bacteroidetes bacterium]|nr:hypothetical protein [Bacteroidota bacterium]
MIDRKEAGEYVDRMKASAFTAWLSGSSKLGFSKYLSGLGLSEKTDPLSPEQVRLEAKRSLEIAEKIKNADTKRIL